MPWLLHRHLNTEFPGHWKSAVTCAVDSLTACAVWVVTVLHCILHCVTRGWLCGEPSNSPVVCVCVGRRGAISHCIPIYLGKYCGFWSHWGLAAVTAVDWVQLLIIQSFHYFSFPCLSSFHFAVVVLILHYAVVSSLSVAQTGLKHSEVWWCKCNRLCKC